MVLYKTILILEDNLKALSVLLKKLFELENETEYDLSVIVLTNYKQVEDYFNSNPRAGFDIALVDRDCKLNGTFHVLDFERFGIDKIIAISSIPQYNEELRVTGVNKIVLKDLGNLEDFADKVGEEIRRMLIPKRLKDLLNQE